MSRSWTDEDILDALSGTRCKQRQFSEDLVAKVHFVVAAELRRRPGADRLQMEDLVQSVLMYMVDGSWRVLRLWDRTRGMSFWSFASLVARKRVARLLQPSRRPLATANFVGHDEPPGADSERSFDDDIDASLRLAQVLRHAENCKISERDRRIAYRVLVEDGDREQICTEEQISRANIDQIVKRCRERLRRCFYNTATHTTVAVEQRQPSELDTWNAQRSYR